MATKADTQSLKAGAGRMTSFAPAKVNLTLEIKGKREDGYHELESLVLFADFGDQLSYSPADRFSLAVSGPFSDALASGSNLVEKTAHAYAEAFRTSRAAAFQLVKHLPVAAGLGGGSADAAAALRLLRDANGVPEDLSELIPLAREIGADVPCCLTSRGAIMTGVGEKLHMLSPIPPIPALLVNPMRPLATRDVFRALNAGPLVKTAQELNVPVFATPDDVVAYADARRNDLEPAARALLPEIDEIFANLASMNGVRLVRLSGSGPTCFALFTTITEAQEAAAELSLDCPDWWVQPVMLS